MINGQHVTTDWLNMFGLTVEEAMAEINAFISRHKAGLNGCHSCALFYNSLFDTEAMFDTFGRNYVEDLFPYVGCIYEIMKLPVTWAALKKGFPASDFSLEAICRRLKVINESPHCALADATATSEVLRQIPATKRIHLLSLTMTKCRDRLVAESIYPPSISIDDYFEFVFDNSLLVDGSNLTGLRHAFDNQVELDRTSLAGLPSNCTPVHAMRSGSASETEESLRVQLDESECMINDLISTVNHLRTKVDTLQVRNDTLQVKNDTLSKDLNKREGQLLHALEQVDYLAECDIYQKPAMATSPASWI